MARYERETKHYDFAVLTHLVEIGQATFYDGPAIYVIKTEDGTVAVRPHQVVFTATEAPFEIVVSDRYQTVTEEQIIEIGQGQPTADEVTVTAPDPVTPPALAKKGWVSPQEQDDILKYFGV